MELEDETYPESVASGTVSVESYIFDYEEENGRTYHAYKPGRYWGSNDEAAQEHEGISHELYTETFERPFLCRLNHEPDRILDLGTGTGIWAQAVADVCPNALVTGTDLSPIQAGWVSPNLYFVVEDMEEELPYPDNTFDLIHIRGLDGSIRNWSRLFRRCLRCLKPGGYLEHAEYSTFFTSTDGTIFHDTPIAQWNRLLLQSHEASGTEIQAISRTKRRMTIAGFEDVSIFSCPWPIRDWAEEPYYQRLGNLAKRHVDMGLENWAMRRFTKYTGWEREGVSVLCAAIRRQLADENVHAIQEVNVVHGRKPDQAV